MSPRDLQPVTPSIDWLADAEDAGPWRAWWSAAEPSTALASARDAWTRIETALATPPSLATSEWVGLIRAASERLEEALETSFPEDSAASAASGLFLSGLNRELAVRLAPVRCGLVFPGARFDPDSMESVDALSGNRFLVHRVRSWLVRDVSGPKPRIAARARVVTA